MPDPATAPVAALAVDRMDMPHLQRQVREACVKHEGVMSAHQAVRRYLRIEAAQTLLDDGQQRNPVVVILGGALAPAATRGDVTDRFGEVDAEGAR
jgi:endonuclease/exonuclease/phosphatase family metal-dependent hydrolase